MDAPDGREQHGHIFVADVLGRRFDRHQPVVTFFY